MTGASCVVTQMIQADQAKRLMTLASDLAEAVAEMNLTRIRSIDHHIRSAAIAMIGSDVTGAGLSMQQRDALAGALDALEHARLEISRVCSPEPRRGAAQIYLAHEGRSDR